MEETYSLNDLAMMTGFTTRTLRNYLTQGLLNGEKKAEYAKKLGFPEGFSFHVAIAVGYPDTEKTPHTFDFENNVTIL